MSSPIIYGSVQDVVADRIRTMILSGQLRPGDRLRQGELAEMLGVSTSPVREALRRLQADGLVVFYPRRGAAVPKLSMSEYEEIYRIRQELEVLACRWAAQDFSRIPLDQLWQLLVDLEEAEAQQDVPRRLRLVRRFLFIIFEASEKQHLLRLLLSLWDLSQQYRRYFSHMADVASERLEQFRRMYQACEAQDVEALVKARRDLYTVADVTLAPRLSAQDTPLVSLHPGSAVMTSQCLSGRPSSRTND